MDGLTEDPNYRDGVPWDRMVSKVMTVGRLKEILSEVPDDTHVTMDDRNEWYVNIQGAYVPSEGEHCSVILVAGEEIDTRQW